MGGGNDKRRGASTGARKTFRVSDTQLPPDLADRLSPLPPDSEAVRAAHAILRDFYLGERFDSEELKLGEFHPIGDPSMPPKEAVSTLIEYVLKQTPYPTELRRHFETLLLQRFETASTSEQAKLLAYWIALCGAEVPVEWTVDLTRVPEDQSLSEDAVKLAKELVNRDYFERAAVHVLGGKHANRERLERLIDEVIDARFPSLSDGKREDLGVHLKSAYISAGLGQKSRLVAFWWTIRNQETPPQPAPAANPPMRPKPTRPKDK